MKPFLFVPILAAIFLSSCGVRTALPQESQPTLTLPVASATGSPLAVTPSHTPTVTASPTPTSTVTPTPTAIPLNFGPDNFHQFVQIQTYIATIEAAIGKGFFDMRLDALAYSPDGRYVALGGCTGNWNGNCINDVWGGHSYLFILDARTAEIVTTLPETQVTITGLAFSTDGEKLVYATNSPDRLVIWDMASGKVEKVLWQAKGNGYRRVAISPDGSWIVDVNSTTLRVWEALSGDLLTQKPGGNFGDDLPRFSANGSRLAVFSLDSGLEITIYDTSTWKQISVISLPGDYPGPVAISPDFKLLATSAFVGTGNILLWDGETGAQVGSLEDPLWLGINALGFTPDGQLLLVSGTPSEEAGYDQPFKVWDVSTRQELGGITGQEAFLASRIQFSDDGVSFMTGVSLWSLPDENILLVREALIDFTTALNQGEYDTAAGSFQLYEGDVSYFNSLGLDTTDLPVLLESVCAQASQPCMPVREIFYAEKEAFGDYGLLVSFTAPDGSAYVDADGYDTFWMYADINADGKVIFSTLPPFPRTP